MPPRRPCVRKVWPAQVEKKPTRRKNAEKERRVKKKKEKVDDAKNEKCVSKAKKPKPKTVVVRQTK